MFLIVLNDSCLIIWHCLYQNDSLQQWLEYQIHSCMGNVSQIIKRHNKRVTKTNERLIAPCNCRDKNNCRMNENCRVENVVYKCAASATEKLKEQVCIGVAEGDWKQRYYNRTKSFRNQKHKNDPALSTFL